jgi:transposase
MLKFYRGVPATILCDNPKTAVTRPDRYEPQFTDICQQLSEHYSTTFSATRPLKNTKMRRNRDLKNEVAA